MKMFNRKLFSIILLMNTLANTWCNGTEYTTLSSLIDKKIHNKDSNTVSNTFESYSDDNDNCIKCDINNYINDDFINPNPVPFLVRGTMTERNNQYYLDKMNEIMNGKYIKDYNSIDEEQSVPFIPLIVNYNNEYTLSKIIKEYNYNDQYTPRLTLDPSDKYTDREAQYFIDNLIKHGQVINEDILKIIANKFGSHNINRVIDKYLSYICNVFNTLSSNEDILDYYELLNYNLIQVSANALPFFYNILYGKLPKLQSNNVVFKKIQSKRKYNLLITLQINALQKPIANIFKNSNSINLMEKILYNTNKTNDNIFILDSVINSIISITKDDTFINNENNKNKLLNNFNMYIKNIRTADKIYIDNRLREISNNILFNDNFTSCDTNQYNNLGLLINALKEQTSSFPKELINKNDLILSIKFNNENLKSILEYSFCNNTNNNISNKNIKIIVDTLNDKNIDNNIKHNLLKHIVKLVVSSIINHDNKVDLDSFCTSFIYLLEEENFYILNEAIQHLRHENTAEISQQIANIRNCFHDYFIKKMFEIKINNLVDIVKFNINVSEECIKQRSQFISNVLYEILWNENNSKIFF